MALKFDRHLSSSAAEMPIKFQSDTTIITSKLRLRNFTRFGGKMSYRLVNRGTENRTTSGDHQNSLGALPSTVTKQRWRSPTSGVISLIIFPSYFPFNCKNFSLYWMHHHQVLHMPRQLSCRVKHKLSLVYQNFIRIKILLNHVWP